MFVTYTRLTFLHRPSQSALLTPQFWRSYRASVRTGQVLAVVQYALPRSATSCRGRPARWNIVCAINKHVLCKSTRRCHHDLSSCKKNCQLALQPRINSKTHFSLSPLNSTYWDMAVSSRIDSRWGWHRAYAVAYRAGKPRPSSSISTMPRRRRRLRPPSAYLYCPLLTHNIHR